MSHTRAWTNAELPHAFSGVSDPARVARALAVLEEKERYERVRDRVAAARHEAGHAVMAIANGFRVDEVTIEVNLARQQGGWCRLASPVRALDRRAQSLEERDELERYALVLMAGRAAEDLDGSHSSAANARAAGDGEQLDLLLRSWPDALEEEARAALCAWWRHLARSRLARFWPAVVTVGSEMLLYTTVTGDRAHALFTLAVGPPPALLPPTILPVPHLLPIAS